MRIIAEYEPRGKQRFMRPSLSGDVLASVYTESEMSPRQVRWAVLRS